MNTNFTIHLVLAVAALLLALFVYPFSKTSFLKTYLHAESAIVLLLIVAGVAVTLIYS